MTPTTTRSRLVASVITLAATLAACSSADERSAASGWSGREAFCKASSALAVGAPLPSRQERLATLRTMHLSAPNRWKDLLGSAIRSVETETDMSSRWHTQLVGLIEFIEEACDLNIPRFDPQN